MIKTSRNLLRLLTIAHTFARHDVLFLLEDVRPVRGVTWLVRLFSRRNQEIVGKRPGQRLAMALSALGPTFIKLGQALSTRSDLLGEEIAEDLSDLQDKLAPFPGEEARRLIEAELGRPMELLFASFDDLPVAAASIAQVHFAVTPEGRKVAVKVLRAGVKAAFRKDISLFYWLAELVEQTQPSLRRLKPVESVRAFEDSVVLEMDLRFEAAAAAEMAENFEGDSTFSIPTIDWSRTARGVMTMERIEGLSIDEREALMAAGLSPEEILKKAAVAFFNQVFRDGFFHADMHPGNLFVDRSGNLVAIDFGIVGRIDAKTRRYLGEMMLGFLTGNYRRVAEIHFEAGYVPAEKSLGAFTQACRSIGEPIMGLPMQEISIGRLLGHLFQITETFEMETQPQLLLLQKSMLVAEGVGRKLAPDINMWQMAQPLIEKWMMENLGPAAYLRDGAESAFKTFTKLPHLVSKVEKAAAELSDGLKLDPEIIKLLAESRNNSLIPRWVPWGIALILLAALVLH